MPVFLDRALQDLWATSPLVSGAMRITESHTAMSSSSDGMPKETPGSFTV
jgi:hypothetical protein